jgi:hypothetical protein
VRTDGERATGEVWALGGGSGWVLDGVGGGGFDAVFEMLDCFRCSFSCVDLLASRRVVGGGRSGVGSVA